MLSPVSILAVSKSGWRFSNRDMLLLWLAVSFFELSSAAHFDGRAAASTIFPSKSFWSWIDRYDQFRSNSQRPDVGVWFGAAVCLFLAAIVGVSGSIRCNGKIA